MLAKLVAPKMSCALAGDLDADAADQYYGALMSADLPDSVDVWRMVAQGRCFQGSLPLASMTRLAQSLTSTVGTLQFSLEFGRDEFGIGFAAVHAEGNLPLQCQRTLEPFDWPLLVNVKLGLIRKEEDEAGLPPGYEPLLVQEADIRPSDVIEDELILALPLVPLSPSNAEDEEVVWSSENGSSDNVRPEKLHPFAALSVLKVPASKPSTSKSSAPKPSARKKN
jgi:uncharacterized protein